MKNHFQKFLILFIVILSIIIISNSSFDGREESEFDYEKAKVINIISEDLKKDKIFENLYLGTQDIKVEISNGKYKGDVLNIKNTLDRTNNIKVDEGDKIILEIKKNLDKKNNNKVSIFNHQKENTIYILIFIFFFLIIFLSRWQGVKVIISLLFTGVMIVYFMIPMLFKGYSPIPLTILSVSLTTVVTLLLIDKPNKKTFSAIAGTILGVVVAGIISYIAGDVSNISGLTSNEAEGLIYLAENKGVNINGIAFSAILIASLGAIMDVAMSISSSVFEIHKNNPEVKIQDLFLSGMSIGKDIMGTMSNTLILAFTGSSLNIILLMVAFGIPYTQLVNMNFVVSEVIQGLSGSIGIVLSVPITALISASLAKEHNFIKDGRINNNKSKI